MADSRLTRTLLRRVAGSVVVVALVGLAVGYFQVVPSSSRAGPTPTRSIAAPSSPGTPAPSATGSARPGQHGPGQDQPGVWITAVPARDGSFSVTEIVVLPQAATAITLHPPKLDGANSAFDKVFPQVDRISITADGHDVDVPDGQLEQRSAYPLTRESARIELRYRLAKATVKSTPSREGRAQAAIAPIISDVPEELPVSVTVTGYSVLNLDCPNLQLADQACARGSAPNFQIDQDLPWEHALVVAQLNLLLA